MKDFKPTETIEGQAPVMNEIAKKLAAAMSDYVQGLGEKIGATQEEIFCAILWLTSEYMKEHGSATQPHGWQ